MRNPDDGQVVEIAFPELEGKALQHLPHDLNFHFELNESGKHGQ